MLIFFSLLPPPTDNINTRSLEFKLLIINHSRKTEFQPSSLILAVNSETLSVGVYDSTPTIFLKSFTACEQFPALPPTPKKNILPLFFLMFKIISTIFSIFSGSICFVMSITSER